MEFYQLAKERYSVRKFKEEKVEDTILTKILEAGRLAPTAKNNQPQHIYVIESDKALKTIRSLTKMTFDAPIVLMFAIDKNQQWESPLKTGFTSGHQDISIVATHIMLQATELGLGTTWVNYFNQDEVHNAFNLPNNEEVVLLLPLGYPSLDAKPSERHNERKELNQIVTEL